MLYRFVFEARTRSRFAHPGYTLARASGALHAVVRDGRRERCAQPLGIHRDLDARAFLLKQHHRAAGAQSVSLV
jgi:hypothetical protein